MTRSDFPRTPTTLAEAIHAVEQVRGLAGNAQITMHVGRMNLNAGNYFHLVLLEYRQSPSDESTFIPLQSGNVFRAIESLSVERREYRIELLEGGMVSLDAIVTLLDGTQLRAVEIVPHRLPYKITPLDEKILHAAISIADIKSAVYRSFRHGLSEEDAKRTIVVGDEFIEFGEFSDRSKFIDFGKLAQVEIKPLLLLNIKGEFERMFPDEKSPSEQKISDTLTWAGFWKPKRRPKS